MILNFCQKTGVLIAFMLSSAGAIYAFETPQLIIDADTANEIDDMYAIVRMFHQTKFRILGLASAQWFHVHSGPRTVYASQSINEDLLRMHGRSEIPALLGADQEFGEPWGGNEPRDSAAAQFIIRSARNVQQGEKLSIAAIGATTNVATAIQLAPDIIPKLKVYLMGFRYDWTKRVWNKSEFNVRRDLNAADFLLNSKDLELHVMDANVSMGLVFEQKSSFEKQERMGQVGKYLTEKWAARFAENKSWIMWDLALVQAMLHTDLASEELVETPLENTARKVWVYRSIDASKMHDDFWNSVLSDKTTR